jgi:monoamine oxidase
VEAGAELIGYAHPTWLSLAQHFGLSLVAWSSDSQFDALRLETPTRLNGKLLTRAQNRDVYDEMTREALEVQFANTNAAPTMRQSLLANLALVSGAALHGDPDDFFTMSENARCAGGNDALAQALAREIDSKGGKIHLSSPVEKIKIHKDRVAVTCRGGRPMDADFVVLAIPLLCGRLEISSSSSLQFLRTAL